MPLWQPTKALARPVYYDRDPIPIYMKYQAAVGGHAFTTRATYTPPVGYAAFLEAVNIFWVRFVAAAPVGNADVAFYFFPYYGGNLALLYAFWNNNTVGYKEDYQLSQYGYLAYGDQVSFATSDGSTGGSVSYILSMKGTEFLY